MNLKERNYEFTLGQMATDSFERSVAYNALSNLASNAIKHGKTEPNSAQDITVFEKNHLFLNRKHGRTIVTGF